MGFDLSASAQCDICGEYLKSSDEQCTEHESDEVFQFFFRHMSTNELCSVRATPSHKWYKLESVKGDEWLSWEYLGHRSHVNALVESHNYDDVSDLPPQESSLDAPTDVSE